MNINNTCYTCLKHNFTNMLLQVIIHFKKMINVWPVQTLISGSFSAKKGKCTWLCKRHTADEEKAYIIWFNKRCVFSVVSSRINGSPGMFWHWLYHWVYQEACANERKATLWHIVICQFLSQIPLVVSSNNTLFSREMRGNSILICDKPSKFADIHSIWSKSRV